VADLSMEGGDVMARTRKGSEFLNSKNSFEFSLVSVLKRDSICFGYGDMEYFFKEEI
jgi:hypothetical protein